MYCKCFHVFTLIYINWRNACVFLYTNVDNQKLNVSGNKCMSGTCNLHTNGFLGVVSDIYDNKISEVEEGNGM